eukprot:CAMPEP_0174325788 /NCGR_PEP_ID=MMETSP0810-20121108/13466_1 /TAXON_ID=73025 ORGANISM="Eutreptiella gymnastica-like, Strain CCMP1594" /NCGR_SAMPLE_ID=MMETSP0810 /ASSEMBLY_ACC=CAM_ASM_000659 /LENGTH=42 /DNA_ID= /DNA_START= /DNA_END= /DNA_ORIENTATION=
MPKVMSGPMPRRDPAAPFGKPCAMALRAATLEMIDSLQPYPL